MPVYNPVLKSVLYLKSLIAYAYKLHLISTMPFRLLNILRYICQLFTMQLPRSTHALSYLSLPGLPVFPKMLQPLLNLSCSCSLEETPKLPFSAENWNNLSSYAIVVLLLWHWMINIYNDFLCCIVVDLIPHILTWHKHSVMQSYGPRWLARKVPLNIGTM